jgi:hypothetical protein
MKSLVIGAGQIGNAIYELIKPHHEAFIRDLQETDCGDGIDFLHICYPDSLYFVSDTLKYIDKYKPGATIIHSSVGIGKTEQCGERVVHCPVRGRHPNLTKEIPAFALYVGGSHKETVDKVCAYLESYNLVVKPVDGSHVTEFCKLISNVHMGLEIAWRQEVGRMMERFSVPAKVYEDWEDTYNVGYRFTGDEQLTRPRLSPAPIGGHCILQCTEILENQHASKLLECIRESNGKAKRKAAKNNGADRAAETVNA